MAIAFSCTVLKLVVSTPAGEAAQAPIAWVRKSMNWP
jgi:hypothetical protein